MVSTTVIFIGFAAVVLLLIVAFSGTTNNRHHHVPPPHLYDSYGQYVPMGRSRHFDVEYRPHERIQRIVFTMIFMFILFFFLFVFSSSKPAESTSANLELIRQVQTASPVIKGDEVDSI